MVTSIHSMQKSIKNRNTKTWWNPRWKATEKFKAQTGQKTKESGWWIKKSEGREKKKCSIQEVDLYIMQK